MKRSAAARRMGPFGGCSGSWRRPLPRPRRCGLLRARCGRHPAAATKWRGVFVLLFSFLLLDSQTLTCRLLLCAVVARRKLAAREFGVLAARITVASQGEFNRVQRQGVRGRRRRRRRRPHGADAEDEAVEVAHLTLESVDEGSCSSAAAAEAVPGMLCACGSALYSAAQRRCVAPGAAEEPTDAMSAASSGHDEGNSKDEQEGSAASSSGHDEVAAVADARVGHVLRADASVFEPWWAVECPAFARARETPVDVAIVKDGSRDGEEQQGWAAADCAEVAAAPKKNSRLRELMQNNPALIEGVLGRR